MLGLVTTTGLSVAGYELWTHLKTLSMPATGYVTVSKEPSVRLRNTAASMREELEKSYRLRPDRRLLLSFSVV